MSAYCVVGVTVCSFALSPIMIAEPPDGQTSDCIEHEIKMFTLLIVGSVRTSVLGAIE